MEDILRIGVITSTHGIAGELKVYPTTDDPKRFKKLKNCILKNERETLELEVAGVKFFKNMVIIRFKEFNNINQVEKFKNSELYVTRENAIPLEEGEYYICDLIGLDVIDDKDNHIGKIYDVIQTGANDVYEIEADNGAHYLFPVIDECILNVDIEAGYVVAHIMKGLMD